MRNWEQIEKAWARGDWNEKNVAETVKAALETGALKGFKDSWCYVMLAAYVDDYNSVEVFLGRGAEEKDYQAMRAHWRETRLANENTKERYMRCAAAYRRGLSPAALGAKNDAEIFGVGAKSSAERDLTIDGESAVAIFGRTDVMKSSLPKDALIGVRRYYVGVERKDAVAAPKEVAGFSVSARMLRNSLRVAERSPDEKPLSEAEFAQGLIDSSRNVIEPLHFVDLLGRPCSVDYQAPIFLRGAYCGWVRVGFSRRPKPEEMSAFWNEIYRIASKIDAARPAFDARKRFQARRDRFALTEKLIGFHPDSPQEQDKEERAKLYARLLQTALDDPVCAKYRGALAFLEATVPTLGDKDSRMTVGFAAHKDLLDRIYPWDEEFRSKVIPTGPTRMFQEGFRDVKFPATNAFATSCPALVEPPTAPQGTEETIRKREVAALDQLKAWYATDDAGNLKLPRAEARIVANRYGGERYFVATLVGETLDDLKNPTASDDAPQSSELVSACDSASHRQETLDVSPAYGVWAMFASASAKELNITDALDRQVTTIVGIPFVFDDTTYRAFAFFTTDGANVTPCVTPCGDAGIEIVDPGYYDDLVEALHSVMLEIRLVKNSMERVKAQERAENIRRNAVAAYQEGHSAAKRHADAKDLMEAVRARTSDVAWFCVEKGGFEETIKKNIRGAYYQCTPGNTLEKNFDSIADYNDWVKVDDHIVELWQLANKLEFFHERLEELSKVRDAVGRALKAEKPEQAFLTQKKTDWRSSESAELQELLKTAVGFANEDVKNAEDSLKLDSKEVEGAKLTPFIDDGKFKCRPADFFYTTVFAELLLNARKRGETEVRVSLEEIAGRDGAPYRAAVLSNSGANDDKIPEKWTSLDDDKLNFISGGLSEKHCQLTSLNIGEIQICREKRDDGYAFKVAVLLKGLK